MLKDDRLGQHVPTLHPSEPKPHARAHTGTFAKLNTLEHIKSSAAQLRFFVPAASEELKIAGMTFTTFDLGGHAQGGWVGGAQSSTCHHHQCDRTDFCVCSPQGVEKLPPCHQRRRFPGGLRRLSKIGRIESGTRCKRLPLVSQPPLGLSCEACLLICMCFSGVNDRRDHRKRAYPHPGQQDRQTRGHQRGEAEGNVRIVRTDDRKGRSAPPSPQPPPRVVRVLMLPVRSTPPPFRAPFP